jgi:HEAT repeat protein
MRPVRVFLSLTVITAGAVAAQPPPAGGDDAPIVRRLIDALKDPDAEVRQNLAVALAKFGTAAIDPLTEALKDANPDRRGGAAYALGLIGPPARTALPALLDALGDKEPDVRRQVSYAVGRLIPQRDPRPAPRLGTDPPPFRGVLQ